MPPRRRYDEEKSIADRLREFREMLGYSQHAFAARVGITRPALAAYEETRAPLPWRVFLALHAALGLNPHWLGRGGGHPFAPFDLAAIGEEPAPEEPFRLVYFKRIRTVPNADTPATVDADLHRAAERMLEQFREFAGLGDKARRAMLRAQPDFRATLLRLRDSATAWLAECEPGTSGHLAKWDLGSVFAARHLPPRPPELPADDAKPGEDAGSLKKDLRKCVTEDSMDPMSKEAPNLSRLLQRVRALTAAPGKKTELAGAVGVSLPQLSEWLSDRKGRRKPSGEKTLLLLRWVERQEHH